MGLAENYIRINKELWNNRTDFHLKSDFYDLDGFLNGRSSLNAIELQLLGDVRGKSMLHLQCHFGQDSISLARLGANVTGVDLSDKAIDQARELSKKCGVNIEFINCDIYELPNFLNKKFDIVFTSYGTIGWLPDLNTWAQIVSRFLKPNGKFVFVEFHPIVWMFDDDFTKVAYNYLNTGPIIETQKGTYADKNADIDQEYISWNHGISEVANSLIQNNLEIRSLGEYDYSPYNCFNKTIEFEPHKYRIEHLGNKIPMVYSMLCTKKSG
ncbi:MAG: class I SAM-dependent methyltransferase [Maribacter sp.]|uniref:class I SAM-dependent methyltransferase n=1 Tax=Maribacter sp. TaxID=1897614 RepID=UPI003C7344FB